MPRTAGYILLLGKGDDSSSTALLGVSLLVRYHNVCYNCHKRRLLLSRNAQETSEDSARSEKGGEGEGHLPEVMIWAFFLLDK